MNHCTDEDLVLLHYGEEPRYARHVDACATCTERYRELAATLQAIVADQLPERGDQYGLEVWQRIRHRLPEREPWWRTVLSWQVAAGAACAVLLLAVGFAAGRFWQERPVRQAAGTPVPLPGDDDSRRVLLLTVADHLERSDRILTDIVNAPVEDDIAAEQEWAVDLVAASRLYRQEAIDANEASVAGVLDELERMLLDIVHRPSRVTEEDLQEIRRRMDSAALLFKLRVVGTQLRELTGEGGDPSPQTTPSTIG
jgi:hypothetical protein